MGTGAALSCAAAESWEATRPRAGFQLGSCAKSVAFKQLNCAHGADSPGLDSIRPLGRLAAPEQPALRAAAAACAATGEHTERAVLAP